MMEVAIGLLPTRFPFSSAAALFGWFGKAA